MTAFSKRHRRALSEGGLKVELERDVRGRIARLLRRFNETYAAVSETNWSYETDTLDDLADELLDLYGRDALPNSVGGRGVPSFVKSAPAEHVFDALELFIEHVEEPKRAAYVRQLNELMKEQGERWRMLDGEMVPLDADFARDELAGRADGAIRAAGFEGAGADLRRARNHVADGDGRGAAHRAGAAVESVMMAMLNRDDGKAAKLLQDLLKEGYFNDLPVKLRQPFVREVMSAMAWMRNKLGGHGQGEQPVDVPRAYAELATDLAAAFSYFLITLKLDREGQAPQADQAGEPGAEFRFVPQTDVPRDLSDFAPSGASDDDIPF